MVAQRYFAFWLFLIFSSSSFIGSTSTTSTTATFLVLPGSSSISSPSFHVRSPCANFPLQLVKRRFSTRSLLLAASSSSVQQQQQQQQQQQRRKILLSRRGPYFDLDRRKGTVEFGSTLDLVTTLPHVDNNDVSSSSQKQLISDWLKDERGLALSIWDEKLVTELGNSVYRLQLMTLQFVTLTLSPTVDVKMWTTMTDTTRKTATTTTTPAGSDTGGEINNKNNNKNSEASIPIFQIQSIGFDPRLQLLPGIGTINPDMLGINIFVVGEMRPTLDGRGVQGRIAFATTGNLPPPLLFVPESILKSAANAISDTVAQFAIQSFQRGAVQQYQTFCRKKLQQQQRNV